VCCPVLIVFFYLDTISLSKERNYSLYDLCGEGMYTKIVELFKFGGLEFCSNNLCQNVNLKEYYLSYGFTIYQ
jgi:hypothetical protein